ncbi:hypothetical protein [uncultured Gemella sp.]|uniref:hypothetical protein n=1 Tax=uncultured Gemella sp. TaxID=254352 RepID=UPI0028D3BAC5|nr:hypothetical protein [uncultured Gemella sp.]
MIYLTNEFNKNEQKFIEDVISSGIEVKVLTMKANPIDKDYVHFLPNILTDKINNEKRNNSPLFALKVEVPEYWSINMGYEYGTIWDRGIQRGIINYLNYDEWTVSSVEWWDVKGNVISKDYYGEDGLCFKQEIFDSEEKIISIQYYNQKGNLIMIEDPGNGLFSIFFENMTFLYDENQLWHACVNLINDNEVLVIGDQHIAKFFKDEKIKACYTDKLPLEDEDVNKWLMTVDELYIYHFSVFSKLSLNDRVHHISPLYPKKNTEQYRALIITHTQDVEKIEELTSALPMIEFHIGAITAMGSRLTDLDEMNNVFLYPGMPQSQFFNLLENCNIYLDINHDIEILDAVEESLEKGMLLFAFEETCHRPKYFTSEHMYTTFEVNKMIDYLKQLSISDKVYKEAMNKQLNWIKYSDVKKYRDTFGKEGI